MIYESARVCGFPETTYANQAREHKIFFDKRQYVSWVKSVRKSLTIILVIIAIIIGIVIQYGVYQFGYRNGYRDTLNSTNTTESSESWSETIESFLCGEWTWIKDGTKETSVKVYRYQDNLIGVVTETGEIEAKYQILTGDIYWSDFVYIDDATFTCKCLAKTTSGSVIYCTGYGVIDYENSTFSLHITAPSPYTMVNADRNWVRASA